MKTTLVLLFAFVSAVPAGASTITWFDSGFLTSVNSSTTFPGLTVGTPWSMQFSFDPDAVGTRGFGSTPAMNCNFYPMGSSVFTLGGFTYTSSGGHVATNSNLPGNNCLGVASGAIQFEWSVNWTQEPGAWPLNGHGVLIGGYTDAIYRDGTLPRTPNLTGLNTGFGLFNLVDPMLISFQDRTFAPIALDASPVPEPGTLAMLGAGLAYIARRRVRDTRRLR